MDLKQTSQEYIPPQSTNISELEKLPLNCTLEDAEATAKDGKVFKYKYTQIDGVKYRVPGTVIGQIKQILKEYPNINHVTVNKSGTGMDTKYMVIPIMNIPPGAGQ